MILVSLAIAQCSGKGLFWFVGSPTRLCVCVYVSSRRHRCEMIFAEGASFGLLDDVVYGNGGLTRESIVGLRKVVPIRRLSVTRYSPMHR
jgi:hypothetical protein